MRTHKLFKLIPLLALVLMAALVVAPGCKKKMPKETPPPTEEVDIVPVEEADTTGQGSRELRMEMDRDLARIQTVYFEFDRSEIVSIELDKIGANAEILQKWPDWTVSIEGHCDERGTADYNLALGQRRAEIVRQYLVEKGVLASTLETVSMGEEEPVDAGHDENAWAKNRRVAFQVK